MTSHRTAAKAALVVGILLIAANLRAPVTGLPPILSLIRADFGLSTAAAGALTTLPLLAFALLSPFSAGFARAFGLERALFGALAVIGIGIVLRSTGAAWTLYLGTWIIGMGIAVGNVLLPSLIKRDFPHSIATLTGVYALAMGAVAAFASAVVTPLAAAWGWKPALLAFLVLPVLAAAAWAPQLAGRAPPAASTTTAPPANAIWRSALAWQATLYLGLNSTIYYVVIGWLPTILSEGGLSPAQAGSLHGVMQLASAVPGLLLGPVLRRMRDQRLIAAAVAILSGLALLGIQFAPRHAFLWVPLFGLGAGAHLILGLAFMGLRTRHAGDAASLSGMAQAVGYVLAAIGPMAMGYLHDRLGGWGVPLLLCAALAFVAAGVGLFAGRDLRIGIQPG